MAKTAVIAVSDQHINSTVALAPRITNLDDGGTYRASKPQRWLWECWLDFWQYAGSLDVDRRIVILNGDVGELDTKRRSTQLISLNKATVQSMILQTLEPALDVVDGAIITRGTMAHTGKSGWIEEWLAADLDISIPDKSTSSWWHFRGEIEGVKFDVSHHASMGGLPWTENAAAIKIANIARIRYYEMGQPPPDVVLRAHNHRYADSGDNFDDVYAVCLPCWSLLTEFAYRTGRENSKPDIGGVIFVSDGSGYTKEKRTYGIPQLRRVWSLRI